MILDPFDPEVIARLANGIPDSVIESAQNSPVYKFVKEWKIALPLHIEFRTLPMLFYVPPLLPVMDLGYVLFGEDYKRGALLAGLSAEHTRAGNACGLELGDHLPNVLRLLPRITDPEVREELVSVIVAPAVRQMLQEFEPDRILAKEEVYRKHHKTIIEHAADETRTAYRHAFEALDHMLRADFRLASAPPPEPITTFERRIDAEIDLESGTSCSPA
jgi:hypothetical protein